MKTLLVAALASTLLLGCATDADAQFRPRIQINIPIFTGYLVHENRNYCFYRYPNGQVERVSRDWAYRGERDRYDRDGRWDRYGRYDRDGRRDPAYRYYSDGRYDRDDDSRHDGRWGWGRYQRACPQNYSVRIEFDLNRDRDRYRHDDRDYRDRPTR